MDYQIDSFAEIGGVVVTEVLDEKSSHDTSHDTSEEKNFVNNTESWISIEHSHIEEMENDDICRKFSLNESDYLALLKAFPLRSFVDAVFLDAFAHQDLNSLIDSTSQAFSTIKMYF